MLFFTLLPFLDFDAQGCNICILRQKAVESRQSLVDNMEKKLGKSGGLPQLTGATHLGQGRVGFSSMAQHTADTTRESLASTAKDGDGLVLAQYNGKGVYFQAKLTAIDHTKFGDDEIHLLRIKLNFMKSFFRRKRYRGAKINVQAKKIPKGNEPRIVRIAPEANSHHISDLEVTTEGKVTIGGGGSGGPANININAEASKGNKTSYEGVRLIHGVIQGSQTAMWQVHEESASETGLPPVMNLLMAVCCGSRFSLELHMDIKYKNSWPLPSTIHAPLSSVAGEFTIPSLEDLDKEATNEMKRKIELLLDKAKSFARIEQDRLRDFEIILTEKIKELDPVDGQSTKANTNAIFSKIEGAHKHFLSDWETKSLMYHYVSIKRNYRDKREINLEAGEILNQTQDLLQHIPRNRFLAMVAASNDAHVKASDKATVEPIVPQDLERLSKTLPQDQHEALTGDDTAASPVRQDILESSNDDKITIKPIAPTAEDTTDLCEAADEPSSVVPVDSKQDRRLIESKDVYDRTPLLVAAKDGNAAKVELLLESHADVNSKDDDGRTALSWAATNGHEAVVELLMMRGADVNSKDYDGQTALSWAATNGHEAVVELLMMRNADVNSKDKHGRTALSWAATNGREAVVELLMMRGADVNSKDYDGQTALSRAATNGHEAVVELLMMRDASLAPPASMTRAHRGGHFESTGVLRSLSNVNDSAFDDFNPVGPGYKVTRL
jgi:ankyrin repeat protein